jgi:hypothetical protein
MAASMSITDQYWRTGSTARRLSDPVLWAGLCNAPVGRDPLLEAAYAWHERPHQKPVSSPQAQHVPMFCVEVDGVAARLARLLTPLTWAIVVREEDSPKAVWVRESVQVPRAAYPRVLRSLNSAWRRRWGGLGGPLLAGEQASVVRAQESVATRQAAVALWRIAILTGGYEGPNGVLIVRTKTLDGVQTLTRTARLLRIRAEPAPGEGRTTVMVRDPFHVSHLLNATAWATRA